MTYRRVILFAFSALFAALTWKVAGMSTKPAEVLASTLPWAVVVLMMLPESRLRVGEFLSGLKIWKNDKDERS